MSRTGKGQWPDLPEVQQPPEQGRGGERGGVAWATGAQARPAVRHGLRVWPAEGEGQRLGTGRPLPEQSTHDL